MGNYEYLNEERYQQNNYKLKRIGKTLLITGAIILGLSVLFTILGFVVFGNTAMNGMSWLESGSSSNIIGSAFGSIGLLMVAGFFDSIGFILLIIGAVLMFIAHRREITAFTTQQVMPIAQEGIEKMAPTIGHAAEEIAKGIKKGINEADKM
ncbi:MAG: hypothetical protein PUF50_01875 [Erysipelotrichaceae bacterium]|nr:hypothetical protein [Erysipelotrichaceae bacterium]